MVRCAVRCCPRAACCLLRAAIPGWLQLPQRLVGRQPPGCEPPILPARRVWQPRHRHCMQVQVQHRVERRLQSKGWGGGGSAEDVLVAARASWSADTPAAALRLYGERSRAAAVWQARHSRQSKTRQCHLVKPEPLARPWMQLLQHPPARLNHFSHCGAGGMQRLVGHKEWCRAAAAASKADHRSAPRAAAMHAA